MQSDQERKQLDEAREKERYEVATRRAETHARWNAGYLEGYRLGLKIGIQSWHDDSDEEGLRKAMLSIARDLLARGWPIHLVAVVTELPENDLSALQEV